MPDRREQAPPDGGEHSQTVTNTKHRERRSMVESPASAGANGADAVPATPYNHSPRGSNHTIPAINNHFLLCLFVYRS